MTENSLQILGGFSHKLASIEPSLVNAQPAMSSSFIPSTIVSDSLNAPNRRLPQPTLPSTIPKQSFPVSDPFDNLNQESKFETRPKASHEQTSTPVIDLIGSPNELKSTTPNGASSQNGVYSLGPADSFTYDLCEIDEPLQANIKPKKLSMDSRLSMEDIFQSDRRYVPPKSLPDHQIYEESLSVPSQNSSISSFKMSPSEFSKHPKPSSRTMFQDLSDSPNIQRRRQRLFISDVLRNSPSIDTFYVEGATVGIDAMKVEEDPISKRLYFFLIVEFEEIQNSFVSAPVRVDPNLCREVLNLSPDEYQVMLEKLSSKKERKQFKINMCTKLGELLSGKFIFQINQSSDPPYVGTIVSFLTE